MYQNGKINHFIITQTLIAKVNSWTSCGHHSQLKIGSNVPATILQYVVAIWGWMIRDSRRSNHSSHPNALKFSVWKIRCCYDVVSEFGFQISYGICWHKLPCSIYSNNRLDPNYQGFWGQLDISSRQNIFNMLLPVLQECFGQPLSPDFAARWRGSNSRWNHFLVDCGKN